MAEYGKCKNFRCDWHGPMAAVLRAPDPFNDGDQLIACPDCRDTSIVCGCDEDGCTREASCGTPTHAGYRWTCGKHRPTPTEAADRD